MTDLFPDAWLSARLDERSEQLAELHRDYQELADEWLLMRRTLEFYADRDSYYDQHAHGYGPADLGERARAALAEAVAPVLPTEETDE